MRENPFSVTRWLPHGKSGQWSVAQCRIEQQACIGLYEQTDRGQIPWMNDSPKEYLDHAPLFTVVRGNVLLTGLGLGAVPAFLSQLEFVKSIDVVENSQDVIDLVWSHLKLVTQGKVRLIQADANEFVPEQKYDFVFCDHWLAPTPEDVEAARKHYAPYAGQLMCWTTKGII